MHSDIDLRPFDPKINSKHPRLMGSLCMKFLDDRWKGKGIMRTTPFYLTHALWPWPLAGSNLDSWGVCLYSFMRIGVKGKQLCTWNHFTLPRNPVALGPWPLDPKVHRANTWLVGRLHVTFHEDRCKGETVMRLKPFYLTTRLLTDRQTGWFQYTPLISLKRYNQVWHSLNNFLSKPVDSIRNKELYFIHFYFIQLQAKQQQ